MTTPLHGIISFFIMALFTSNPYLLALAIILGMMPDLVKFLYGENANSWDGLYAECHKLKWYYLIIPFWNLHIVIDYFWHNQDFGGWKPGTYYIETFIWICIAVFVISKVIF